MIDKKAWGTKNVLFKSDTAQLDILYILQGGYSSKHKHNNKFNLFFILAGKIEITLFTKDEEKKIIIGNQEKSQKFIIRPGTFHQFKALQDTECLEYSFVRLTEEDIIRLNEGGCEKQN